MTAKKSETAEPALAVTLTFDRDALQKALTWVSKAIQGHSSLPIMQHVHISVTGGVCSLTCSDLAQWHQERLPVEASGDAALCINAKRFQSLVGMLPAKSRVALSQEDGGKWRVSCGSVEMVFPSLPAEEFPMGDSSDEKVSSRWSLPAKGLSQALSSVLPFVAKDDTRPIHTCVYLTANDEELVVAATDTHRLAKCTPDVPLVCEGETPRLNIPARGAQTLISLCDALGGDAEIAFALTNSGGLLQASVGDYTLSLRLLEGLFPNYERAIPTSYNRAFTVQTGDLMEALSRAGLVAQDDSFRTVFEAGDPKHYHQLVVSASSSFGEHREEIEVAYEGDPIAIAFNYQFAQSALRTAQGIWKAEGVRFTLSEPLRPAILRCVGDAEDKWLCVLMPMRIPVSVSTEGDKTDGK